MQKSPMQPATAPFLVRLNEQSMLRPRAFRNTSILTHGRVFLENGLASDNCQYGQKKFVQHW
jgi:hypothetical protein